MTLRRAASMCVLVVFGLAACGDDGEDRAGDSTRSEGPTTASAAPAGSDGPATTTAGSADATVTGSGSSGADASGDSAEFCAEMQEIAEFNGSQPDPDPSQPWEAYKAESMQLEESLELYEPAIASAPEEIRPQLVQLRDVSVEGFEALEQSSSFEEFAAATGGLFSDEILTATEELDAFLREECGFGLTS